MKKNFSLLLYLTVFFAQSSCTNMLYYPNAYKYTDETKLELPPTEVELEVGEHNDHLNWYFEAKPEHRKPLTILYAHGNGQNMSAHFRSLYWVLNSGFNLFALEYPGYGPNPGKPSPELTVDTVKAGYHWLRKHRPDDAVLVFGQSLGGNVVLRAVSEMPEMKICGVVIEGSFLSYKSIASHALTRSWITWLFQWLPYLVIDDSKSAQRNISNMPNSNYLVIHGDKDQTVPISFGEDLFKSLPEPKLFWKVSDGRHSNTFHAHPEYRNMFVNWVLENCERE